MRRNNRYKTKLIPAAEQRAIKAEKREKKAIEQDLKDHPEKRLAALEEKIILLGAPGAMLIEKFKNTKPVNRRIKCLLKGVQEFKKLVEDQQKYKEVPVDIETFIKSPEYLNDGESIYPKVLDELKQMVAGGHSEVVFTGSIGAAKTAASLYLLAYHLYLLSCLRSPQRTYGVQNSEEIVIIFQSVNATQAKTVAYGKFKRMIEVSPYFKKNFQFNRTVDSELRFPNSITVRPIAGGANAALGQCTIAALIDECVTADTLITTPYGAVPIAALKKGDLVVGVDDNGQTVVDKVTEHRLTGTKKVFRFVLDTGEHICCTYNHPIATQRGWIKAADLTIEDYIYGISKRENSSCSMEEKNESCRKRKKTPTSYGRVEKEYVSCTEETCGHPGGKGAYSAQYGEDASLLQERKGQERAEYSSQEEFSSLCQVKRAQRAHPPKVHSYEQYRRNASQEISIQCEEVCGRVQANAYAGSKRKSSSSKNRRTPQQCHERENVEKSYPGDERGGIHSQVSLPIKQMYDKEFQIELRNQGIKNAGKRPQCDSGILRERMGGVSKRGGFEDNGGRFFSPNKNREIFVRSKEQLRRIQGVQEDTSGTEIRRSEWDAVRTLDRGQLTSIECIGELPVYNIETEKTHTYIANGIVTHNCNFMTITQKSKQSRDAGVYDQAWENYNSLSRRRKNRFSKLGKTPGVICLVSSKRYPGEFTDIKAEEAKTNPDIYIYDKRAWDIVPPGKYSGATFRLFIGDNARKPRILQEGELLGPDDAALIMNVPIEERHEFEKDLMGALRDVAGVTTMALEPFIIDIDKVRSCFDTYDSILSRESCDFSTTNIEIYPDKFKRLDQPRFVHIDLAMTGDSAGISCGYVAGFTNVVRNEEEGIDEVLPIICMDFMLEVFPPKNEEIQFYKIRSLLYKLRELGLNIKWVSFDLFQAVDSIQMLSRKGYVTGVQSMDKTTVPYDITKVALMDGRVHAPMHEKCYMEIISLERDAKKNKIDHRPNFSKDCADSFAGVVYGLTMRREIWLKYGIPLVTIPGHLVAATNNYKNSVDRRQSTDLEE